MHFLSKASPTRTSLYNEIGFGGGIAGRRAMSIARLLVAVLFLSAAAHADYLYSFTGPNSGDDFSFTVPALLTAGVATSLAITPITIDGATFTTAGYSEGPLLTCFAFAETGSSYDLEGDGQCGFSPPNKILELIAQQPIDATGVYSLGRFNTSGASIGTNKLTITSETSAVPEPTSVILLGTLCAMAGWRVRKHGRS